MYLKELYKIGAHSNLAPRLSMSGAILLLPPSVPVVACYVAITLPLRIIGMSPQGIEPSR